MTIICPACHTENRDIAKFCIECVGTLPSRMAGLDDFPTERAEIRATRRSVRRWAAVERSRGWYLGVGAVLIALTFGSAGWWIAGAGDTPRGETLQADGASSVQAAGQVSAKVVPAAQAATAPASAAMAAPAPSPLAASASRSTGPAKKDATPAAAAVPRAEPAVSPAASPRKAAASAPRGAPTPPVAAQRASEEPRAACAGMNIFAAARCMAAQCLKSEFKPHAQCDEVRRQQRLDEEKRNPSMAN